MPLKQCDCLLSYIYWASKCKESAQLQLFADRVGVALTERR